MTRWPEVPEEESDDKEWYAIYEDATSGFGFDTLMSGIQHLSLGEPVDPNAPPCYDIIEDYPAPPDAPILLLDGMDVRCLILGLADPPPHPDLELAEPEPDPGESTEQTED